MSNLLELKGLSPVIEKITIERKDWKAEKLTYKQALAYLTTFKTPKGLEEDIKALNLIVANDRQLFEYNKFKSEIQDLINNENLAGNSKFENEKIIMRVRITTVEPNENTK